MNYSQSNNQQEPHETDAGMQQDLVKNPSFHLGQNEPGGFRLRKSLIWSFVIAFVILGTAAAIYIFTLPVTHERKKGVYNAKDGSVYQVEDYIKKQLAHPESFKAIHWSTVQKSANLIDTDMYQVSVIYKATDSRGKSFMASKTFELDEQGVVWMEMETDPFKSTPLQR